MEIILFNEEINRRYQTLVKNIKTVSNSYYDSFLDLLETTIKFIFDDNNIEYNKASTCGAIIKEEQCKSFLLQELKIDSYTYDKLPDYIKKCNDHKHKKEKTLSIDSVINYLRVYFDLVNYYKQYINEEIINFDEEYFKSIFGEAERLNKELRLKLEKINQDLDEAIANKKISEEEANKYKEKLSIKSIENQDLETQNIIMENQISLFSTVQSFMINTLNEMKENQQEILEKVDSIKKDKVNQELNYTSTNKKVFSPQLVRFIQDSKREHVYIGSKEELKKGKKKVLVASLIILFYVIALSILLTKIFEVYTTISLIHDILIFMLICRLLKTMSLNHKMLEDKIKGLSIFKYDYNSYWFYEANFKMKMRFKLPIILTHIFNGLSIFVLIIEYHNILSYITIVLLIVFSISIHFYKEEVEAVYGAYTAIMKISNFDKQTNKEMVLWYSAIDKAFYTYEALRNKYENMKGLLEK